MIHGERDRWDKFTERHAEKLRAAGIPEEVIRERSKFFSSLSEDEQQVANLICSAFADVELGTGIGLREANGLDDYADEKSLAALRVQDEKHDWTVFSPEDLDRYYCSLSFFDAEGMRFHLPAYLIADLRGLLNTADILFHLVYFAHHAEARFEKLSIEQRSSVTEFLMLRFVDPNYAFIHPMIDAAVTGFWNINE